MRNEVAYYPRLFHIEHDVTDQKRSILELLICA